MPPATAGFFPLDEQMGLCEGRWSEGLVREAVWLSGQVPFEHVKGILQRPRGVSISDSSIWRRVQGCGARFGALLWSKCDS